MIDRNPFDVLALPPGGGERDVERAAHKALALLKVGAAGADTYASPLGPRPRDEDLVRWAARELRDPAKRAQYAASVVVVPDETPPPDPLAPWPDAVAAFGWGPR